MQRCFFLPIPPGWGWSICSLFADFSPGKRGEGREKGEPQTPGHSNLRALCAFGASPLGKSTWQRGKGRQARGRKRCLTGITDGRMQQIHARGGETQAIDCVRWLLKIRHHAKVGAGRRVGRNPGEGGPPERPACPGRCWGCRRAEGGAARCLRSERRGSGSSLPPLPLSPLLLTRTAAGFGSWERLSRSTHPSQKRQGGEERGGGGGGGTSHPVITARTKPPHAFNCPHCTAARGICIGFPAGHQLIVSSKT